MVSKFDVAATDPLQYAIQGFGKGFGMGERRAKEQQEFEYQKTQDVEKNRRAEAYLEIAQGNQDIAKQKQQFELMKFGTKSQRDALNNRIENYQYQLDDASTVDLIKGNRARHDNALSELNRRDKLIHLRTLESNKSWDRSGKSSIITGTQRGIDPLTGKEVDVPTYYQWKKGDPGKGTPGEIAQFTREEYQKLITTSGYYDDIKEPLGGDTTKELRQAMSDAQKNIKALNRKRIQDSLSYMKKAGIDPNKEVVLHGIKNVTIDSILQTSDPNKLWGLTDSQKETLMQDIDFGLGGRAAAMKMADKAGPRYARWLADFIESQDTSPAISIGDTMADFALKDPEAARRAFGAAQSGGGLITGKEEAKEQVKRDIRDVGISKKITAANIKQIEGIATLGFEPTESDIKWMSGREATATKMFTLKKTKKQADRRYLLDTYKAGKSTERTKELERKAFGGKDPSKKAPEKDTTLGEDLGDFAKGAYDYFRAPTAYERVIEGK